MQRRLANIDLILILILILKRSAQIPNYSYRHGETQRAQMVIEHINFVFIPEIFVSSCLIRECGPGQCYGRVRNSLADSYGCVVVCTECLKSCVNCRYTKRWTPGEVKGKAKAKLRNARHSMLNLLCLILDRRIFLSTLLYTLLAFFTITCNEVSSNIFYS